MVEQLTMAILLHRYRAVGRRLQVGMAMEGATDTAPTMSWIDLGPVEQLDLAEDLTAETVAEILNKAIREGRPV